MHISSKAIRLHRTGLPILRPVRLLSENNTRAPLFAILVELKIRLLKTLRSEPAAIEMSIGFSASKGKYGGFVKTRPKDPFRRQEPLSQRTVST